MHLKSNTDLASIVKDASFINDEQSTGSRRFSSDQYISRVPLCACMCRLMFPESYCLDASTQHLDNQPSYPFSRALVAVGGSGACVRHIVGPSGPFRFFAGSLAFFLFCTGCIILEY